MPPLKGEKGFAERIFARSLAGAVVLWVFSATGASPGPVVEAFFGKEALPYGWVTGVFREGGDVWVATRGGTRIYSETERSWREPPKEIQGQMVTGVARYGGKLYVATEKCLNVGATDGWSAELKLAKASAENGDLAVSGEKLWMAARTMVGGLLEYDGKEWKLLSRGPGTGVMNNITRLLSWKGELWAATGNNGIYRWKPDGWTVIGPEDGLPALRVTSLAGTKDGVYAGTVAGLAFYDGKKWNVFKTEEGLPSNKISVLKVVNGRVLVGTFDRGISILDGKRFENIGRAGGLSDDRIEAIEAVGDTIWVGTVNGLSRVRIS